MKTSSLLSLTFGLLTLVSTLAHAAVNAPQGSTRPLDIPTQIIVTATQCQGGKQITIADRYYTPEEMSLHGIVYVSIKDQKGRTLGHIEVTQIPKDQPRLIKAALYVLSSVPMETVVPVTSLILGLGVNDDFTANQISAYATDNSTGICRNPLNEGRYFLGLLKGNIQ